MGLDFAIRKLEWPDDAPSWSYVGFMEFRRRLAESIGITIDEMEGYGNLIDKKPWPSAEQEPLVFLLNHSDSDGELSAEQCQKVAPRLREICSAWPDHDYDRSNGLRLAAMMEEVVKQDGELIFT